MPPPPPSDNTTIRVSVDAAVKMEEGMFRDFIQYTIVTELVHDDPEDYDSVPDIKTFRVGRRYRDFDNLLHQLQISTRAGTNSSASSASGSSENVGDMVPVLPSLPPKRTLRISRNTKEDHAESRRRSLQYWLRHLISHPTLRASKPLRIFLTATRKNEATSSADWVEPQLHFLPSNAKSVVREQPSTTLRYRIVMKEALHNISKQADRLAQPLSNAMEQTEALSTNLHVRSDTFGEFANSLQALPQCEKRGSAERFCWSAMCAGTAGSVSSHKRIASSIEFDLLDLLRHHTISVLPVFRGRVSVLKEQSSNIVKKMQKADDTRNSSGDIDSHHGMNESTMNGGGGGSAGGTLSPGGRRRSSIRVQSEGLEDATALLRQEWAVLNRIRSAGFAADAAKFARSAAAAHWNIAASWESARNGLLQALESVPDVEPTFSPTDTLFSAPVHKALGRVPEYAQMRESMEEVSEEEEDEETENNEGGLDSNLNPSSRSSSVDTTSSSSMAEAVEEARRMSEGKDRDPLSGAFNDPVIEIHKSKPIIRPALRRRKSSVSGSGSGGGSSGSFGFGEDGEDVADVGKVQKVDRERGRAKKEGDGSRRGRSTSNNRRGDREEKDMEKDKDKDREKDRDKDRGHVSDDPFTDVVEQVNGSGGGGGRGEKVSGKTPGTIRKKKAAARGRVNMSQGLKSMHHTSKKDENSLQREAANVEEVLMQKHKQREEGVGIGGGRGGRFGGGLGGGSKGEGVGGGGGGEGLGKKKSGEPSYFNNSTPTPGRGGKGREISSAGSSSDALDADYLSNMSKATAKAAAVKGFNKPSGGSSVPVHLRLHLL
ncbi:hypothetical protein TL16_g13071 [Triparma laevis f. inornata]|uniref:PX domain-containing protein n=1 Tax=Triparma laevis f. inornata TaxID=1714386 RepID=A0A9W7BVU9_9STRA|nr:hypothetical protein TL16_g13071 [Triparma laevis f. inornata]